MQEPIPLERPELDASKRLELREAWRRLCDLTREALDSAGANYVAGGRAGVVVVAATGVKEQELRDLINEWGGNVDPDPDDPREDLLDRFEKALRVIAGNPPDAADIARDALGG
jgi:hypothetical protein